MVANAVASALFGGAVIAGILAAAPGVASEPPPGPDDSIRELELVSRVYGNTRTIRVLLPPGYDDPANRDRRYPVLYFTDGAAAFYPEAWDVPGVARRLWREGRIQEVIVVGIDNGASTRETTNPERDRASEYLPYPDDTWEGSDVPKPRGDRFPEFLFDEVVPRVDREFRTSSEGPIGLAGDSYGAAAALYAALTNPGRVSRLLLESPPLHISARRLLADARKAERWPAAVYLGVGAAEGATPEIQEKVVANVRELSNIIDGHPAVRHCLVVAEGATHWFDAWRDRLPEALIFLYGTESSDQ